MNEGKKFKEGKYCGFRDNNKCNSYCGLFNVGLGACVLHSMNLNLQKLTSTLEEMKGETNGKKNNIAKSN